MMPLISTMPLDRPISRLSGAPELARYAERFVNSTCHIIGLGFDDVAPYELRDKSWIYFPEPDLPFHRVTIFSNYSPYNVPRPGAQWSLLAEVSASPCKPVESQTVVEATLAGFRRCGFVSGATPVATWWHRHLEYGYPTHLRWAGTRC